MKQSEDCCSTGFAIFTQQVSFILSVIHSLLLISHPLGKDLHKKVVHVILSQLASHHNLWAIEQVAVVVFGQGAHCIVRIMQFHVKEQSAGYFFIEPL